MAAKKFRYTTPKRVKEKRFYPRRFKSWTTAEYLVEYFRLNKIFVPAPYEVGGQVIVV